MLAWVGPAGTNVAFHSAMGVQLCDFDSNRMLSLIYADDGGNSWGGDDNYACLTWLSPDVPNTDGNGMTWLSLTLLGGEGILFGSGVLANGATIELPGGWNAAQSFACAYIHDTSIGAGVGHIMYLAGAWVDGALGVHCQMQDHSGNVWNGNARVLVFAWKNNMGTVTSQTLGSGTWLKFPLSDGSTFGVGCAKNMADSSTLALPASAGATLEPMVGPSDDFYTSGGGHAQGVGSCYLDSNDVVHCTFNDGSGDTWTGAADIFATYTVAAVAPATILAVSAPTSSIPAAGLQSFSAQLNGAPTQDVIWSVNGIPGGNLTVGTIDAYGNYGAPNLGGIHTVTATSVADPTVSGSATVTVVGTVLTGTAIVTDEHGNYIAVGDDVMGLE